MNIEILNKLTQNQDIAQNLKVLSENATGKIVFSTSFGIEDQLITDVIFSQKLKNIEVFTLDTGRLFQETYATWHKTELHYNQKIKSFYPNTEDLEIFINERGINPFYESQELRKQCCYIRKVEPLQRALKDTKVWITGLRAEHSPNRNSIETVQWDEQYQLYKYNPLLHWTSDEVKEYVNSKGIPYNVLHDKGFISIGCAPCTRAVKEGEDFRAGRWWWEDASKKECGLHG
ncbi:adenylylsulfate reductase [Flavobacterium enshiense DK69]|uniref:Adenosine 5'-phosphosulfate reductase n=1 Tax=Flavobacterium enshiense DK69 TaxID=1107311 RepID=V6SFG1_9FLAO|nr:phosphoadenylyl-sulfate reductase [Flavobacterium enshiense]ESU25179.1 adenylylsulfate reductase [Flavobacterium enshiense DK69]KGO96927.1 phosphoadenosine phosphosulfate reductase [Flavobacterium enshiense DK69]